MAVPCGDTVEDGVRAIACFEVDAADPGWIGASFEALGDGAVERGVDGVSDMHLRFVDDATGIVVGYCCIGLLLAGQGPRGDNTTRNGWYIHCG